MNQLVEKLVTVVAEEAEHCERLLTLLRQQQEYLVESNTTGLESNVREQENAIRRSRDLERRRTDLVENIAQGLVLNDEEPTLSRLIGLLSSDYGRRLGSLRDSMGRSIELVSKTKDQNRMLIEQSMYNIDEVMRMLATTSASAADYATVATGKTATVPLSVDRVG